ncbi:hypothetical protein ACFX1Z_025521 [Malus domestica]
MKVALYPKHKPNQIHVSKNEFVKLTVPGFARIFVWIWVLLGFKCFSHLVKVKWRLKQGSSVGCILQISSNYDIPAMAQVEVEDLVIQLEESLELSNMEEGVKLIGEALTKL